MNQTLNQPKQLNLPVKIFIGLALGVIAGLLLRLFPDFSTQATKYVIDPAGKLFLTLIKMTIIPLVFSSLVVGACGLGDIKKIGRIGIKSVLFFLTTTAFAVTLGLLVGKFFNVGNGFSIPTELSQVPDKAQQPPDFIETILDIVPSNPFAALTNGNMLQIIFFALFLGSAIIMVGKKAEAFKDAITSFSEIMQQIIGSIMKLAPYAVFALICSVVISNGIEALMPLLMLIIAVYFACILHAIIVYSSLLATIGKTNPLVFFKAMIPSILLGYSSASSVSSIPLTSKAAEELGVPSHIRSFIIPLGATINMDGTAVFQGICVLFIANAYGLPLSASALLTIVMTATLASIGTAGVPGAGTVMLGMVLESVGLPLEGIVLIIGVERILDMARTVVNVTGDCACSIVVASLEKELHKESITT